MRTIVLTLALLIVSMPGRAQQRPVTDTRLPVAAFGDYRVPVGRMENGVLRITLEAGVAAWQPWGKDGPTVRADVFAADGTAPRIPGAADPRHRRHTRAHHAPKCAQRFDRRPRPARLQHESAA
jgi:hypothetical protein